MTTLYGIKNCDTVKKARLWLESHAVAYTFHDFRTDGLNSELLETLESALGWETLLNRRGTTWRKLEEGQRDELDRDKAMALMLAQPSLIKRPVLVTAGKILCGYTPDDYTALL